ncbi:MAG: hypothetical protein JXB25_09635 [Deltaproteobacteria bacterium]|nr:hypothetical protein [Deltaproteobacteria bacterium]
MNGRQVAILAISLAVSGLLLWNYLPLQHPGFFAKLIALALSLFVVLVLAIIAYVFAGGKKKPS